VRVPAQTGFRPRHATTHHAFVLQHLIDKYKRRGKRLFCCFVDLAKAYDSVPRDLLWQRLHDVGVRGRMLHAIKGMYDVGVDMHIKTPTGTLDPIHTSVGVKQGCPLSPTLFGLYIDGLQHHVASECPAAGPALQSAPHVRLSLLIYADDTAILANSAQELQQLLTSVDSWCCTQGMTISIVKSEVMVFNCKSPEQLVNVSVQGKQLPVSRVFKYLGVWFHFRKGAAHNVQKAAARGKFAIACMHRKLYELDVGSNVNLSLNLYHSLVLPAMLYGCEVWGTCALGCKAPADSGVLPEQVHRNFIRFALKMRHKTKAWVAYREAGMYPLQYTCMHRMLAFLDGVLALDDGEYAKIAMLDCIEEARSASVNNWFSKLSKLLAHVNGGTTPADALHPDGSVDVDKCLMLWRKHHHTTVWGNLSIDPRTAPSKNISLCTYERLFSTPLPDDHDHWRPAPCITVDNIPYSQLISLIRLRTNSHNLNIERLRHTRPRVPRANRACPWCRTPGAVHDELHCVMECPHISQTRLRYPALFGPRSDERDMRTLFTDEVLAAPLASFVHSFPSVTD
jgi:Reverse transcriptase (RNA-dependent DNA polymerase)